MQAFQSLKEFICSDSVGGKLKVVKFLKNIFSCSLSFCVYTWSTGRFPVSKAKVLVGQTEPEVF